MKKVLIVAYFYPPAGEMGTFRTLKFTQYLPEFGFNPLVLTVRNRSVGALDETLLDEVPRETKVIATVSAEHRLLRAPRLLGVNEKWFSIPDQHIGWLPSAVRHGEAAIRKEGIDMIFATAPVFTSLLVGYALKKRTRKPLVLELRDPWTQNVFVTYPTRFHRKIEERLEKAVLQSADFVVTTTEEMTRALVEKYPFMRNRCITIRNGFDSSDFHGLERCAPRGRFTITYAGRLYGLRTAEHFLTAVRNVIRRHDHLRHSMRVLFAGPKNRRTSSLVERLGLGDVVEMVGFVAHRESLRLMVNADVLLLVMSGREVVGNGIETMVIPGKTFQYLGARRPILALAPQGAAADLIRETGSGVVVPPEDLGAIEGAILELFDRWRAGTLGVAPCDLSAFESRTSTERLSTILEAVCCSGGGG